MIPILNQSNVSKWVSKLVREKVSNKDATQLKRGQGEEWYDRARYDMLCITVNNISL